MTAALVLGGVFGVSVLAAWRWSHPTLEHLPTTLDRLHNPIPAASRSAIPYSLGGWADRLGSGLGQLVGSRGLLFGDATRADLRIVSRTGEQHAAAKASVAVVGGVLPAACAGLIALGGIAADVGWVTAVSVLLAGVGFVVPDLLVRAEAAERRRDFTVALGAYLDLVVISLAGGAGVEGALRDAARLGQGWAFTQLRTALEHAQLAGTSLWTALARLGDDLAVLALGELAASASLAGTQGARVRESLTAKAAAVRNRQLSDAEATAQAATERMAVPTVLLLAGFVLLVGYPAIHAVLTGI